MAKLATFLLAAFAVLLAFTTPSIAGDPDMLQQGRTQIKIVGGAEDTPHVRRNCSPAPPSRGWPTWSLGGAWGGAQVCRPCRGGSSPPCCPVTSAAVLQDICVADYKSLRGPLRLNGFPCKRPENVTANDFFSYVLANPGNTGNAAGSAVTAANVEKLPGLNTLGVSMARIDYAPWGVNPPHTHPRASEMIFVLKGSLDVGFITTANKLYARTVCKGEVFVFPRGLVHYQKNNGNTPAAVISAFNSQLQGTQSVAETLFGASPTVPTYVLARTFQIDGSLVEGIKSKFPPK